MLCALALVAACGPTVPPAAMESSSPAAADILARHNFARGVNGLGDLVVDGDMQAHAQYHADRLAAGAAGCAGSLWHSTELASWYPGQRVGENVACVPGCPGDGAAAFGLWWNSLPHKENILRPEFTHMGAATTCNGSVQLVVVQYRSG